MPEERKLVTVVFADVVGSTSMGESLDPEDLRTLMGRYYEHGRGTVESHGGTLEKFIGDAVVAVFGLPVAHDDDAERALSTSLSLMEALDADELLRDRLRLRIGVNTGEVMAIGDRSGDDLLITGDAVNVAARLQQAALPGEILASERTKLATLGTFIFGPLQEIELKGKSVPARVFRLIERAAEREREGGRAMRPDFIGREQDLAQLLLLGERALQERRPQLVSLIAPAGTGKTRLLQEFLARVEPSHGFRVATAKCLPYGQARTYWPLRGLLESLLGAQPSHEKVRQVFVEGGCDAADATRLAEQILSSLGIDLHPGAGLPEREIVFNAWRLLVESIARQAPLIVVFEDLQWAGDSLLDLVEHVMHPRTSAPLVILTLSRPELLDRRPAWGAGRRSFSALSLEPLTQDHTVALITATGGSLPASLRKRIAERSGGNPFFALELVRGLAERGIGGEGAPPDLAGTDALPDTVHAAVLARLDLLSAVERRVLQAASVIGRSFRAPVVATLLEDVPVQQIETAIDELLARDLIVPGDGGTLAFRHILTRDVAYGTLSRADRVRMHLSAAAWLEDFAGSRIDELVDLVAYHYREAALLGRRSAIPIENPDGRAKAVYFLEKAGRVASAAGAFAEASEHLRDAVEIAPEGERGHLYEALGDVARWGDAAVSAYRTALERWRTSEPQDPAVGARLLRKLLMIYMRWLGSVSSRPAREEMLSMRREARRLAEQTGDEAEQWRLRTADLFWYFWTGEANREKTEEAVGVGDALQIAENAATYFESHEEWDWFHASLDAAAETAHMLGDLTRQALLVDRRLAAPETNRFEWGDALNMRAWAHADLGEFRQAVQLICDAAEKLRPGEPIAHLANGLSIAAFAAMAGGLWSESPHLEALLEQAWEDLRRDPSAGFLFVGLISTLHVALGREDQAMVDAIVALLWPIVDFPDRRAHKLSVEAYMRDDAALLTGLAREDKGPGPAALIGLPFFLERGLLPPEELIEEVRRHALHGKALQVYLEVAEATREGDVRQLAQAIDRADRAGLTPHAARMRINLAQLSGDPSPLNEARSSLVALGDLQFLRRLEEVASGMAVASAT